MQRAFVHAHEVITGSGVRSSDGRRLKPEHLDRIEDGCVVTDRGKIAWVGKTRDLPKKHLKAKRIDLAREKMIMPGMIDCHTHLVFAGDRSDEFAMRCTGMSYAELARQGKGILTTVNATRKASTKELTDLAILRVEEARSFGIRTLEIKSGYGLDYDSELKQLKVIRSLKKHFKDMTFSATFLGAHDFPKDQTRSAYLKVLLEKMLPEVARKKLADSCDVFLDEGFYSHDEAARILSVAKKLGLNIKLHGDELSNMESAKLAATLGALSCDHLLKVSDDGIRTLAQSETVAVLLPATAFFLKTAQAPARRLLDAGACVALSTDFNPGTSPTLNLPMIMTFAALQLQMNVAEIFAAVTYSAAKALGLHHRKGSVLPGFDADIAIQPFRRFEELYYRFGWVPTR